ncbi:hypothetical protein ZRA01_02930 [Zoogloea ramigera]|uniref:Restriction endonuclease type II NgoFVII N-terminal domain-containing protein n=1 Tax=Zoogloea ramigera TaxID=350 RepID=A0A4Y4CUF2_ZOORA|nr:restriction endonuclease PLD domain-containing protein [Zoogloea ramigera]GEC94220.1 hypothetical protein ZRA01_02930 [Zoogloea ramigera]
MTIYILNNDHGRSAEEIIDNEILSLNRVKQRRHELWILTCYVDFGILEEYVEHLLKRIRITDVYLTFNFSEIYKDGPKNTAKKLREITSRLKNKSVNFQWRALASSKLVHAKGYALIQRSNGAVSGGIVLTTSANFTTPGFKGENVEIGYLSTKKKDINDFEKTYDYLWESLGKDIESAVFKQEKYLLQYALLSSGLFLHKWSGSLSQHLGIKYKLTPLAKEKGAIAPELAAVGFEAGDTFTRQVLNMSELPAKDIPSSFIKQFTIETYWGRWCPLDAWNALSTSFEGAGQFIKEFEIATIESTLIDASEKALAVQNDLVAKGLIKPVNENHLENWVARIMELRSNRRRLERFYIGYEAHELPYTIDQKAEIEELFDSLMEAVELSKSTNVAKKKIIAAMTKANPNVLALSNEQIQRVREMSRSA